MADQTIPLEGLSGLEVSAVSGDLHLTGWSRDEIRITDPEGLAQSKPKKGVLHLTSTGDLFVHLPHSLPVAVVSVSGDATLRGISSDLAIQSVSGDLSLRDVGSARIKSVMGDLLVSRIQGALRADSVSGDGLIEDVQGQVEIKNLSGDLQLEKVDGGIDIKAGGDGSIEFHPVPWQAYRFMVGGDLSVTMPIDCDADLSIKSGEQNIKLFPGKLDIIAEQKQLDHRLGEGGTSIQFTAGGKVFLLDEEFTVFTGIKLNLEDLGDFTADFSTETAEQIRSNLGHLEEDLRESLSGLSASLAEIGLSEESLRHLGAEIEETSRKAAEKAEMAAIKAQAKVHKKIAKARRKALEAHEKTKQFDLNEFLQAKAARDTVSEKERMLILKMLQEKKISADEADNLLKALEGK